MRAGKRRSLEKKGWVVGDTKGFLGLSEEEMALVDLKLDLARNLKVARHRSHLSQGTLARRIHSSQSRIAKMEAGDRSVSIELLLRALLALGTTRRQLAKMIAKAA